MDAVLSPDARFLYVANLDDDLLSAYRVDADTGAVRDIGMGAVNAVPALRRSFIREAAGLTGDLPALMK